MNTNNGIKGGVILIGSLLWETKELNPFGDAEKKLSELRQIWRNKYLDIDNQSLKPMPIRYGRCSNKRACTYTMVFSRSCLKINSGMSSIIPFKDSFDDDGSNFKSMALELALVEGISDSSNNKLRKSWGCIALYINPKSIFLEKIKSMWEVLKESDTDYRDKNTRNFQINNRLENSTLLNDDYTLSSDINIDTELDFLFLTYIKPINRNNNIKEYPTSTDIATEIGRSGYDTYLKQNIVNGISTFQDKEILAILTS